MDKRRYGTVGMLGLWYVAQMYVCVCVFVCVCVCV